jgi:hypothetical protein
VAETERALARKLPKALPAYREALQSAQLRIMHDPSAKDVRAHEHVIAHKTDVPIVVAAIQAGVGYLVTLNRRHLIDDPGVAERSGLRIGTPGQALVWVRRQLTGRLALNRETGIMQHEKPLLFCLRFALPQISIRNKTHLNNGGIQCLAE